MRYLGVLAAVLIVCAFSACSTEKRGGQKVSAETAAAFGDVTLPQGAQVLATAADSGRDTRYRLSLRLTDSQLRDFLAQFPAQPRPSEVPKTITVDDSEIREALGECVATIMNAIRVALERTPPELSADISDRGIVLTGGGALLKNLDKRIREETGLPVSIADDPLASVVLGTGKMLTEFKLLRRIAIE